MKSFISWALMFMFVSPGFSQQSYTKSEACEELGDVAYVAALTAYNERAARKGYGGYHHAQPTAQAMAADKLDILNDADTYDTVSEIVDIIVIEIYKMPGSSFRSDSFQVFTRGYEIADRFKKRAQSKCMLGEIDIGY